jgi:hypothetical protein
MPASEAAYYAVASLPLWVAPALLVAGALSVPLVPKTAQRAIALGSLAAAAIAIAPSLPEALSGHHVVSVATRLARVGSLDLVLGFDLDRVSSALAVLVLGFTALALRPSGPAEKRPSVALFVAAGALLAVLADGLAAWALGVGAAVAGAALASERPWEQVRAKLGSASVALSAVALGFAYLAWALGGQWLDGSRYFSDWGARFVVPRDSAAVDPVPTLARDPHATGSLTLVSNPGARVYVGVADELGLARSEPLAVSPFARVAVPAGLQKIVVIPGDAAIIGGEGLEAALIDAVPITAGKETVIELVGPSLTFSEVASQVGPRKLASRRLGSSLAATMLVGLIALGVLFFALFVGHRRGGRRGTEELALDALVALPVAALAYRLAAVLGASEPALLVAGALGAAFAAHVAYDTWFRPDGPSDRERAPLAIALALSPALAATGIALAAPVAIVLTALAACLAGRRLAPAPTATTPTGGVAVAKRPKKKRSPR